MFVGKGTELYQDKIYSMEVIPKNQDIATTEGMQIAMHFSKRELEIIGAALRNQRNVLNIYKFDTNFSPLVRKNFSDLGIEIEKIINLLPPSA